MWEEIAIMLEEHGLWGLLILAFAESSFFPLAPDFLLIPLCLARPERALLFALLCTVMSVVGARFGYFLGQTLGQPILERLVPRSLINTVKNMFERYGGWAILIAALIPLPFKVFTIASGCFSMHIPKFLLASLIGRGVRFLAEALLVIFMGDQALMLIKTNFSEVAIILAIVITIMYLLLKQGGKLKAWIKVNVKKPGIIKSIWPK